MNAPRPILVVGAGPTGLTAALELSRFGVPVRIIDRRPEPSTTSRALALHARTRELLDRRGPGPEMERLGQIVGAGSFYGGGKRLARIDLTAIPSRHNSILMLSQAETERLLAEQVACQGVTIERGVELIGFAQHHAAGHPEQDGITAVLRDASGRLESVEASYLIAAEGAHSTVRETLNIPFAGRSLADRYALTDLHIEGDLPADEFTIFAGRDGLIALFPLGPGHFRIIATEPDGHPDSDDPPGLPELQAIYDAGASIPARLHGLVWSSRFRINSRMVDHLRDRRIFLGGDSAHIHSPAGGQGMNTGIQDMINLGWKLALVARGQASPDLLDTYSAERIPIIRKVVERTERGTDAMNSRNPVVHALLTHVAPWLLGSETIQHLAVGQISQVDHHYRGGPLAGRHHGHAPLHPGDRVPDGPVRVDTQGPGTSVPLYERLDPSRFTLLLAGDPPPDLPPAVAEVVERRPDLVAIERVSPDPAGGAVAERTRVGDLFGHGPNLILVRPDAYVAATGRAGDGPEVVAWLDRWCPVA